MPVPDFRRGEELTASDLNQLALAIKQLQEGSPGAIPGFGSPRGMVLAMALAHPDVFLPARITAAPGSDPGPPPTPMYRSVFSYDAVAIWKAGVTLAGVRPSYGTDVLADDCKIYPALVGDLCVIVRAPSDTGEPTAELWILTEKVYRRACVPPP